MTDLEHPSGQQTEFAGFDEREARVIEKKEFFEPYKDILRGLFHALDRDGQWSDDPSDEVFQSYLRSKLIGSEHGNATEKDQFTPEQEAAAQPYLDQLGMTKELVPPVGAQFEQTVAFGGTMVREHKVTTLVKNMEDQDIELGDVVFLYGQRPREKRDGTNEELLSIEGRFSGHDISNNPRVINYVAQALESDDPWSLTETDFGRIALNKVFGGELVPTKITLPIIEVNGVSTGLAPKMPDVPGRDVLDYDYVTDKGRKTLMNTAAIDRGDRPSRPKTKSTVGEWLERRAPKQGAKVLLVTGNPTALRQTQAAYQIAQEYGRGDIEFVVAATAPAPNMPIQSYLGEVAALIIKDVEENYQESAV